MYIITILVKYDTWDHREILSRSVESECSWAVQKKEIEKTFNTGKALFGIRIHNITDENNNKANKGDNPFDFVYFNGKKLSNYIEIYEPKGEDNKSILDDINHNLERLVYEAIENKKNYQNI